MDLVLEQTLILQLTPVALYFSQPRLRKAFEISLFGPINLTRVLLPHYREQRKGVLLFMSSISVYLGAVEAGAYSATKGALESKFLRSPSYLALSPRALTFLISEICANTNTIISLRHVRLSPRRSVPIWNRMLPRDARLFPYQHLRPHKRQDWYIKHP